MVPMNFGNRDWYKLARERLQKLREETERKAENEWAKKREPVLEKLKSVLDNIKAAKDKGAKRSISFCSREYLVA
jgi:molecular chaperone GrpE (heat shock protein)